MGHMFGASYLDESGAPAYASDPAWAEMFQWQHDFIAEVYGDGDFQTGADRLRKFLAGAGNEWNQAQDFQQGRVAIQIDGEWRNAFLDDYAPDLAYDTAPMPTSPSTTDRYGSGVAGGTIIGMPEGRAAPGRGMAADQVPRHEHGHARVHGELREQRAHDERGARLARPGAARAVRHVHGRLRAPGVGLPADHGDREELEQYLSNFAADWQTGDATDLQAGLAQATEQTQNALDQAKL